MTQLEIGGRLGGDWWEIGGRLVGDWWEIGGRLVGDWWEIGGRLGGRLGGDWGKRWHVLHFFFVIFGVIFFFGARLRLTFCEQLATWLVPRQGSQGSHVRVIFVFSLTKIALVTFEPYLKIQKKADFQSYTRTFFKKLVRHSKLVKHLV